MLQINKPPQFSIEFQGSLISIRKKSFKSMGLCLPPNTPLRTEFFTWHILPKINWHLILFDLRGPRSPMGWSIQGGSLNNDLTVLKLRGFYYFIKISLSITTWWSRFFRFLIMISDKIGDGPRVSSNKL